MRPPICDVCGDDVDPGDGALVTCLSTAAGEAFAERAEQPGFVGHPPDQGWFCPDHHVEAQRLSSTMTLDQVVAAIRAASTNETVTPLVDEADTPSAPTVRDPAAPVDAPSLGPTEKVCHICGVVFEEKTAGLVTFARTAEGTAWHHAMIQGEVSGTSPDAAWLCARHVVPALWISRSFTRAQAMELLAPPGRPPLEYDERPATIDPDRDPATFPQRTPFAPVDDGGLDAVPEEIRTFSPHAPRRLRRLLFTKRADLGRALGVGELRDCGSTSSTSDHPAHARWGPANAVVSVGHRPHQADDVVLFLNGLTYPAEARTGPIVQSAEGFLVQQREQSLIELWLVPGEPPTVAEDGLVLLERAVIRRSPALDVDVSSALDLVIDELIEELGSATSNPLDPAPDLTDIDLGTGRIERKKLLGVGSKVVWSAGGSLDRARTTFVESLPAFLAAVGVEEPIALTASTNRSWTPMDGVGPPDCPFTDSWTWNGRSDSVEVSITATSHNWNETSVSNTSANLHIEVAGETKLSLSHSQRLDSGSRRPSLTLNRPTTPAVVAVVRRLFDC